MKATARYIPMKGWCAQLEGEELNMAQIRYRQDLIPLTKGQEIEGEIKDGIFEITMK